MSRATIGSLRYSSHNSSRVKFFQNVIFASRIKKLFRSILVFFHGPQGFCFLSLLLILDIHSLTHYLVGVIHSSQSFPSMPLCNAWQRAYQSASTKRGLHLSGSIWSTSINAFELSTSSALNVNSSGLSLTVTSDHPSGTLGFRTFKSSRASAQRSTIHGAIIVHPDEMTHAVSPFLLSSPKFVTMLYRSPSPSSCWFACNFNALVSLRTGLEVPHALRRPFPARNFPCMHDQQPVWLSPVVLFLHTLRSTTLYVFPRDPPNVVFQRVTVAMRA